MHGRHKHLEEFRRRVNAMAEALNEFAYPVIPIGQQHPNFKSDIGRVSLGRLIKDLYLFVEIHGNKVQEDAEKEYHERLNTPVPPYLLDPKVAEACGLTQQQIVDTYYGRRTKT